MSYQKLNQATRQFTLPIPLYDDTVQDIYSEARYFIDMDMNSGYWKLVMKEEAYERLELFTLDRNCW